MEKYISMLLFAANPMHGYTIIRKNRVLLKQLVLRNIKSRYKGTVMGVSWSFIQPLLMLCIYTFVFSVVFKNRWDAGNGALEGGSTSSFAVVMFCGMTIFNVFSESISSAAMLIAGNPNYVKKVIFPIETLPIAQVISAMILNLIWFSILLVGAAFILNSVSFTMLLLPVTLIPLCLFTCGISFFIASLGVYFRDLQYMIGIVVQMMFFLTPIFYPISLVPERFRIFLAINPLTLIVEDTRALFLFNTLPNWKTCAISFVVSALCFQLGLVWLMKTKKGFSDVL